MQLRSRPVNHISVSEVIKFIYEKLLGFSWRLRAQNISKPIRNRSSRSEMTFFKPMSASVSKLRHSKYNCCFCVVFFLLMQMSIDALWVNYCIMNTKSEICVV